MKQLSINLHTDNNHFKKQFLSVSLLLFFLALICIKTNAQNPTVTINQAATQADPTPNAPISFTVVFDQPVTGFTTGDVVISGTAGANVSVVTSVNPTTYSVAVAGMTSCGTVVANIPAGVCTNALLQPNLASNSLDNTVTYTSFLSTVNPVPNQQICAGTATNAVNFTSTPAGAAFTWVNNNPSIGLAASGTGNIPSFTAINTTATAVTATITVTANNGTCPGGSSGFTITVNPLPVVIVTPNTTCGGSCASLTASGADNYTWSPISGLYTNCPITQAYTGTNLATVYTSSGNSNIYTVVGQNATTGCFKAATGRPNYTPPAPVVVPPSVTMCLGDPAVKLNIVTAVTNQFCSGPVNIAVPDNNPAGVTSSIAVTGIPVGATIQEVWVSINMPHTKIGNMVFVLKAPNTGILNLDHYLSGTGGTGATTGFNNTNISSISTHILSSGVNPYTGVFGADAQAGSGPTGYIQTVTTWAGLLAGPLNGNWTLAFYDGVTGDVGTLTSWCINFRYAVGNNAPVTPGVWSPAAGMYSNSSALPLYAYVPGTMVDSVWTRPIPAGVYPYQVVTYGQALLLCTPTTNFVANNGNALVTFNVKNNHPYPIKVSQIDSKTLTAGPALVNVYYKNTGIAGSPGAISAANGWVQFGTASINGNGASVQPFISNASLTIPPGATYAICVEALTAGNAPNLAYSALTPGIYSFNDDGCELIASTNVGYSGLNAPAAPTVNSSGFIGAVHFTRSTATCPSAPTTVVVTVGQGITITTQPANQVVCTGNAASFTVGLTGTGSFTYQWQVSTNGGATFTNIVNGGVYSGVLTNTLMVTAPPVTMNGYLFKVVINGGFGCNAGTSNAALLTVNPLPVIVLTANPLVIGPGQTTTIRSAVTPSPAAVYTWYYNGNILPGANADTLLVDLNGLGDYQLKVTDVNGCSNLSNIITIAHSFALNLFAYPNPSGGVFQVRYFSEVNSAVKRSLIIYNNRGDRIINRTFTQTIPYQKIDVDVRANGKGIYWVELRDADGKRLAMNRVVVQ